ncbi:Protein kinase protein with adenine nucleotide alpha hydrolase-like domain [Zea mays]|uniref:Protein kinase protein with adenine nucleotide alpha hydrolase-like domain n=3 Tax=Zea mays TaxID=4577 RepID=A0A1D6FYM9_MAIZE|nr:Protein kinase protein with adenine nucleotide alpha hydrolase-like domain [Zea mays]AQK96432.1 Protein kinase protein with adenine nucleotide alpha hydrolase-like domain [Zea mays]AQK96433.1 Protein kinase protein with adenine nucleotide alpha hydrolase-like domain [Zea mays]AQK96434.1 Protein kinase protein with adenine nucleotide alpha hydrolase-like domain [Zea mays]AQK96435.1 Protein kinase protein with adenine nucleotide alpha hydrolase-like domain [Zea mays]
MIVGSSQQQLLLQRKGKPVAGKGAASMTVKAEKVVVAVRAATREISKTAVIWALTHVVQPGGSIILLVVIPAQSSGRKFWGFPLFAGDCASGHKSMVDQKCDLSELCSQMLKKLDVYDIDMINVMYKLVSGSPSGVVAAECKQAQASWVVLDKDLKHEEKRCVEELQCNIVVMKRSQPKVLRLNLVGSPDKESKATCAVPPVLDCSSGKTATDVKEARSSIRGPAVTPNSSPDLDTPFRSTEAGTSSVSSSDPGASPFSASEINGSLKKEVLATKDKIQHSDVNISDSDSETLSPPANFSFQPWMSDILQGSASSRSLGKVPRKTRTATADVLLEKISKLDLLNEISAMRSRSDLNFRGDVRDAVSLARNAPPGPPPLCSICQHKAPVFGKPPRWFSYAELELATGGFSQANFLAEGGFGSVHQGVLPDGQAIAVKQHKLASSQGDVEFCSEVEVLSCAQHRNVVMLIGFCVEDRRRLLVYEYICNRSLDSHLYGRNRETLEWTARHKIAVGAARGLRYLHEECRVGCIIHRDMRPNNILVTHDFEPLVGDFGLARWQPDGDMGVETRVIGTFGYLAPEYAQSGQITEKADVYSFGVVLVELVTGRKAVDINRPKGQQLLTEWARPFLEEYAIDELIDPRLGARYSENEVHCMLHAANLCIRRDPHSRPRMSHVLRILEGDMVVESGSVNGSSDSGSRSWRLLSEQQHYCQEYRVARLNKNREGQARGNAPTADRDKQSISNRY